MLSAAVVTVRKPADGFQAFPVSRSPLYYYKRFFVFFCLSFYYIDVMSHAPLVKFGQYICYSFDMKFCSSYIKDPSLHRCTQVFPVASGSLVSTPQVQWHL